MAKTKADDDKKAGGEGGDAGGAWSFDSIPDALREASKRAADLAKNPYAQGLLAAGMVAAAAALASNKNARESMKRNLRGATEAAEVAADNAGKVGLAIINAATEAVQHMLSLTTGAAAAAAKEAAAAPQGSGGASSATGQAPGKTGTARSKSAGQAPAKTGAGKSKSESAAAPKRARAAASKSGGSTSKAGKSSGTASKSAE
jgi:hypothetical protein